MNKQARKIVLHEVSENCTLTSPPVRQGDYSLDSPAAELMVDFSKVHAVTASTTLSVNDALELMKANRIRALMVVDRHSRFTGIISSIDLMGRKPLAYANEAGIALSEVQVKDIMIRKHQLRAMSKNDVQRATLGDILRVLRAVHEQHVLVVDGDTEQVCGLFSASDFSRALGIKIDYLKVAHTFMDLERVINKHKEVM